MRRPFLQLCCIIALLIAQQGALTHAVWHAHAPPPFHGDQSRHVDDEGHAGGGHDAPHGTSWLCAFDLAYGTVLGGVSGGAGLPVACAAGVERALQLEPARFRVRPVPYLSRGPPAPV